MTRLLATTTLALALLFQPHGAEAGPRSRAFKAHRYFMKDMKKGRLAGPTQHALNNMMATAFWLLEEKGFHQEAEEMEREWKDQFSSYLLQQNLGALDLGDHNPLSQWLGKMYKKLEDLVGPSALSSLHLDDINTLNYAIPVVFRPSLNWGQGEYRLHFVPFAGVLSYWTAFAACEIGLALVSLPFSLKFICGPLASGLEHATVKWWGPKLSDRIYGLAHRRGMTFDPLLGFQ